MKFKDNKKAKKLSTQGLDASAIKLTTKTVSKDQLCEDFSIVWYNMTQLKKELTEKRYIKVLEKIITNPFMSDDQIPLKSDVEKLLFLNLEELRATTTLMIEVMYNDLKLKEEGAKDATG